MSELRKTLERLRSKRANGDMKLKTGLVKFMRDNGKNPEVVLAGIHVPEVLGKNVKGVGIPEGKTILDVFAGRSPDEDVMMIRNRMAEGNMKFVAGDKEVDVHEMCSILADVQDRLETAESDMAKIKQEELTKAESCAQEPAPKIRKNAPSARSMGAFRYVPVSMGATHLESFDPRDVIRMAEQARASKCELVRYTARNGGAHIRSVEEETDDMESENALFDICMHGGANIEKDQEEHARVFFADHPSKLRHFVVDSNSVDAYRAFANSTGHGNVGESHLTYAVENVHPFEKYAGSALMEILTFGMGASNPSMRLAAASEIVRGGSDVVKRWVPHMTSSARADAYQLVKIAHGARFMESVDTFFNKTASEMHREKGGIDIPWDDLDAWEEQYPSLMDDVEGEENEDFIERSEENVIETPDPSAADIKSKQIDQYTMAVIDAEKSLHEVEFEMKDVENEILRLKKQHDEAQAEFSQAQNDLKELESRSDHFSEPVLAEKRKNLQAAESAARKKLDDLTQKTYVQKAKWDALKKKTDGWWDKISKNTGILKRNSEQFFKRTFLSSSTLLPKTVQIADAMVNFLQFYFSFGKDFYEALREVMIDQGMAPLDASLYTIKSIPELRMFIENLVEFNRRAPWPQVSGGYTYQPPFIPSANNDVRYRALYEQSEVLRAFLDDAIRLGDVKAAIANLYAKDGVEDADKLRKFRSFLDWLGDEVACTSKGLSKNATKGIQAKKNQTFCRVSGGEAMAMAGMGIGYGGESFLATLWDRVLLAVDKTGQKLVYMIPRLDVGFHATDRMRELPEYKKQYAMQYDLMRDELWNEYMDIRPKVGDVHGMSEPRFADWARLNSYLLYHDVMNAYPKKLRLLKEDKLAINHQFEEMPSLLYDEYFQQRLVQPRVAPEELVWAGVAARLQQGKAVRGVSGGHSSNREFSVETHHGDVEGEHTALGEAHVGAVEANKGGAFRNLTRASAMACARHEDYLATDHDAVDFKLSTNGLYLQMGSQYMPQNLEDFMSDVNHGLKKLFNPITDPFKYPEPYPKAVASKPPRPTGLVNAVISSVADCAEATKKLVIDAPFDALTADTMTGIVTEGTKTAANAIKMKAEIPVNFGKDVVRTVKSDVKSIERARASWNREIMNDLDIGRGMADDVLVTGDWNYDKMEFDNVPGEGTMNDNYANALDEVAIINTKSMTLIDAFMTTYGLDKKNYLIITPVNSAMNPGVDTLIATSDAHRDFFVMCHLFPRALMDPRGSELISLAATRVEVSDLLLGTVDTQNVSWIADKSINAQNIKTADVIESTIVLPQAFLMLLISDLDTNKDGEIETWINYKEVKTNSRLAEKLFGK